MDRTVCKVIVGFGMTRIQMNGALMAIYLNTRTNFCCLLRLLRKTGNARLPEATSPAYRQAGR